MTFLNLTADELETVQEGLEKLKNELRASGDTSAVVNVLLIQAQVQVVLDEKKEPSKGFYCNPL